jgi:hypothetical protein
MASRTPTPKGIDVLLVDFDGVLHPADVHASGPKHSPQIELRALGHQLFENVEFLEWALSNYPHVSIVLSSSWCLHYGLEYARRQLTPGLQSRVIGTTFEPGNPLLWRMPKMSRWGQISCDLARRNPRRWLAVDDDGIAWPTQERDKLVLTPAALGLQCPKAQSDLIARLAAHFE